MNKTAVQDLLGDFSAVPPDGPMSLKDGRPITFWVPAAVKVKYDYLQKKSERRFSKKTREVLIELINLAEERIV